MAVDLGDYHGHGEHHAEHKALVVQPRTILYCSTWYLKEPEKNMNASFAGISMHLSDEVRAGFMRQFHDSIADKLILQFHHSETFNAVASTDFYNFAMMSIGRNIKGIFVPADLLPYMRMLKLVEDSKEIGWMGCMLSGKPSGPKSEKMVLDEITELTVGWYNNIRENG